MEKKQLFDSSLVGFHPEVFNPYLQISVDIGDNDYTSNFSIDQTISVDDDFINNYNNTPINSVGVLAINMTYNGDQIVRHIMNFVKGNEGTYANHIRDGFTYCISINNINTVGKTIDLTITSRSDNTVVKLTTKFTGIDFLTKGDFDETITLTDKEYNTLNEIPVGEIFILQDFVKDVDLIAFKAGIKSFRGYRDFISDNLLHRSLISSVIELGENNQLRFRGNVAKLIDANNYLAKDNTTEYTPTADYNPATKKYVDDKIDKPLLDVSNLLLKVRNGGRDTPIDVTDEIINLFGSVNAIRTDSGKYRFVSSGAFVNFNSFLNINEFTFSAALGGRINGDDDPTVYSNKNSITIYYYNFKINDDNTAVTGYYNNTNIIRDPDRLNQYLSADGTYKYPYAAGIFFSKDNRQVTNRNYWGNYVIEKTDNNGACILVLISDCSKLYNEVATNDLNINKVFGIGGYGILTRIYSNSYPYSKPILIEAVIGHDTGSYYFRLYTSNWMVFPCVVKYQDKYYIAIRFGNIDKDRRVMGSYLNIIGMSANLLDSYIYLNCEEGELYPTGVEVIQEGTYFDKENIKRDRDNLLAKTNEDGYMSKEDKTKLDNTPVQKILTESQYAALGTAPQTDNVLYFVTPD